MHFAGRIGSSVFRRRPSNLSRALKNNLLCFCIPLVGVWISQPIAAFWIHPSRAVYSTRHHRNLIGPRDLIRRHLVVPEQESTSSYDNDLGALTVPQLKELLREAGKPVSGRKAELIERLQSSTMPGSSKRAAAQPTEGEDSSPRKRSRATTNGTKKAAPKGGDNAKKAGDHQRVTERVPLQKLWNAEEAASRGSYSKSDFLLLYISIWYL
jgi:hypothetical protein